MSREEIAVRYLEILKVFSKKYRFEDTWNSTTIKVYYYNFKVNGKSR